MPSDVPPPPSRLLRARFLTVIGRSHQAVYTDDLLNLAASLEAKNGSPSSKRFCAQILAIGPIVLNSIPQ